MENVLNSIKSLKGKKILDVASGHGEFISLLQKYLPDYKSIVGIDISKTLLERARSQFKDERIEFQNMDAYTMSFQDNSFDIAAISNSLHHFKQPQQVLTEMMRVTKNRGKIIVHEMISDDLTKAQQSHKKLHHWSAKIDMLNNVYHAETYTEQDLLRLVKEQLHAVDMMSYNYPIEHNRDEKLIDRMTGYLDLILKKAEGHSEFDELKKEAEEIRVYIENNGYEPATFVYLIAENEE